MDGLTDLTGRIFEVGIEVRQPGFYERDNLFSKFLPRCGKELNAPFLISE